MKKPTIKRFTAIHLKDTIAVAMSVLTPPLPHVVLAGVPMVVCRRSLKYRPICTAPIYGLPAGFANPLDVVGPLPPPQDVPKPTVDTSRESALVVIPVAPAASVVIPDPVFISDSEQVGALPEEA
jgi:hypothetical protein